MKLILSSCIPSDHPVFFIETGLDIENNFEPVVVISDDVGSETDSSLKLRTKEWFKFMSIPFFQKDQIGHDVVEGPSFLPEFPGQRIDHIGAYKIISDDKSIRVLYEKDNKTAIVIYPSQYQEMKNNLFDLISLSMEFLQRYWLYVIYVYSRFLNFYVQIPSDSETPKPIEHVTIEELPIIPSMKMIYTELDFTVCKIIQSQLRILAKEKIYNAAAAVKSTYYQTWRTINHIYT